MRDAGNFRIHMDGRWSLSDLYDFPHSLSQVYAFYYCFNTDLPPRDAERIDIALREYPWGGGFSIVNIFTVLQNQVPPRHRPKITSIHYASPGWMELLLNVEAMVSVAASVASIAGSLVAVTKSYTSIQKMLHDLRVYKAKSQLDYLKIQKDQAVALRELCDELSQQIGFHKFDELVQRSGGDVEVAAKLLSAQFRRLSNIADYQSKGKAVLPHGLIEKF